MNIRKHVLGLAVSSALALSMQAHAGLLGGSLGGGGALNGGLNGLGTLGASGTMNGSFNTNLDGVHHVTSRVKQNVETKTTTAVDHAEKVSTKTANDASASAQLATSNAINTAAEAKQTGTDVASSVKSPTKVSDNAAQGMDASLEHKPVNAAVNTQNSAAVSAER